MEPITPAEFRSAVENRPGPVVRVAFSPLQQCYEFLVDEFGVVCDDDELIGTPLDARMPDFPWVVEPSNDDWPGLLRLEPPHSVECVRLLCDFLDMTWQLG